LKNINALKLKME